jgi:hypothetical protein
VNVLLCTHRVVSERDHVRHQVPVNLTFWAAAAAAAAGAADDVVQYPRPKRPCDFTPSSSYLWVKNLPSLPEQEAKGERQQLHSQASILI